LDVGRELEAELPALLCSLSLAETSQQTIEDAFKDFTNREDIAVLLINQHVRRAGSARLQHAAAAHTFAHLTTPNHGPTP
jgi:vacuolar-type H+-ATPase subunit F/Vma7